MRNEVGEVELVNARETGKRGRESLAEGDPEKVAAWEEKRNGKE